MPPVEDIGCQVGFNGKFQWSMGKIAVKITVPKIERKKKKMECNKENMNKELNLQDLDTVVGGYTVDQLTQEEFARHEELRRRGSQARADYQNGKISAGEYHEIAAEFTAFQIQMKRKYG